MSAMQAYLAESCEQMASLAREMRELADERMVQGLVAEAEDMRRIADRALAVRLRCEVVLERRYGVFVDPA
jgi:hypothetical protein